MLKLISETTGLTCVSLIAGAPPDTPKGAYKISTVNYGQTIGTKPRDFASFDKEAFSAKVLNQFARFLQETKGKAHMSEISPCADRHIVWDAAATVAEGHQLIPGPSEPATVATNVEAEVALDVTKTAATTKQSRKRPR